MPLARWLRHSAATNFPSLLAEFDSWQQYKSSRWQNANRQHAASTRSPRNHLRNKVALASVNLTRNVVTSPVMPFTTREIESPDAVTRVTAADAALREPGQDDIGEKMVLNMGPSHPATHGVLRLVL